MIWHIEWFATTKSGLLNTPSYVAATRERKRLKQNKDINKIVIFDDGAWRKHIWTRE